MSLNEAIFNCQVREKKIHILNFKLKFIWNVFLFYGFLATISWFLATMLCCNIHHCNARCYFILNSAQLKINIANGYMKRQS